MPLANVDVPDDPDATPDALLQEFARHGNRIALLEEIYRRANGKPTAETHAAESDIDVDDTAAVVEHATGVFREQREQAETPESDYLFTLELAYGEVADHVEEDTV